MGRWTGLRLRRRRLQLMCLAIGVWIIGAGPRAELLAADLNPQQASSLLTDLLGQYFEDRPNQAVMFGVLPDALQNQYAPDRRELAICLDDARLSAPVPSSGVQLIGLMPAGMREFLPFAAEVELVLPPPLAVTAPPSIEKISAMLGGNIDVLIRKKRIGGVVISYPQVNAKARTITFEVSHLDDMPTSTISEAKKLFQSAEFQQEVGALAAKTAERAAKQDVADTVREQLLKKAPEVEAIVESDVLGFKISIPPLTTGRASSEASGGTGAQIANSEVRLTAPPGKKPPQFQKEELARLTGMVRDAARNSHRPYHWFLLERVPPFRFGSLIFYGQFKSAQSSTSFFLAQAVRVLSPLPTLPQIDAGRKLKDRLQVLTQSGSIAFLTDLRSCFVVRFDRGQAVN